MRTLARNFSCAAKLESDRGDHEACRRQKKAWRGLGQASRARVRARAGPPRALRLLRPGLLPPPLRRPGSQAAAQLGGDATVERPAVGEEPREREADRRSQRAARE